GPSGRAFPHLPRGGALRRGRSEAHARGHATHLPEECLVIFLVYHPRDQLDPARTREPGERGGKAPSPLPIMPAVEEERQVGARTLESSGPAPSAQSRADLLGGDAETGRDGGRRERGERRVRDLMASGKRDLALQAACEECADPTLRSVRRTAPLCTRPERESRASVRERLDARDVQERARPERRAGSQGAF